MLIPEHKYLVKKVYPTEQLPNGNHKFQRIILIKPGYTDEFGDKKGKDDLYEIKVWNNAIDELPELNPGDKVKAVLGINGVEHVDRNSGQVMYFTQISARKIEKL